MVQIEREQDIEVLRQVATLLDRENQKLVDRVRGLTHELARLRGQDAASAQRELAFLKELLAKRNQALFGDSSEKRSQNGQTPEAAPPAPPRGHGPRPQPELPIEERVHELPADERQCPVCGGDLAEMKDQTEDSEEITVVERRFVVVKHRRRKYRCRCNACVATAPPPPKLQPGSRYSVAFAVEVAAAKYLDHLPLERQCRIMGREGLLVDSQTLWDQIDVLARHLAPTYEAIGREVLASPLVFADETFWRLMGSEEKSRWYAWTVASPDAVFYRMQDSRSQDAAKRVLAEYRGIVMADGYGVYGALARAGPSFTLVNCWAHARRKFVECEANFPKECGEILDLIGELYAVERLVPPAKNGDAAEALRLRAELRQTRSRQIVRAIRDWAMAQRPLPQSGLGGAIEYMFKLWNGLVAFVEDPRIPLDNNAAERALRGVVLGRKNHYGSRSRRGTEVAALFYTLFETAKLAGIEPKSYVIAAAHAAIANPGAVTLPSSLASNANN